MAKRSKRRHHLARMKRKARMVSKIHSLNSSNIYEKHYNHLAVCSCHMCGNPRKRLRGKHRLTKKEIIEKEKLINDIINL